MENKTLLIIATLGIAGLFFLRKPIPTSQTFKFKTGANLITFQGYNPSITTADELMISIGKSTICDAINRWNRETQKAEGWISLFGGMGNNFVLKQGEGYEIHVLVDIDWTYDMEVYETIPIEELYIGRNWIGVSLWSKIKTASDLIASIKICEKVSIWDPITQQEIFYYADGSGTNFKITENMGIFVYIGAPPYYWNYMIS